MSTSYFKGIRGLQYLLGVIILSLIFSGCDNEEDKTKRQPGPNRSEIAISIQFLNADSDSNEEPQNVTIEINDLRGQIFTPVGNQAGSYKIENGFLSLVIANRRGEIDLPYRFIIQSFSDGYLKKTQSIVIDEYQNAYVPVFMMPLQDMPQGSSFAQASVLLASGAIIDNGLQLNTKPSSRSGEKGLMANLIIESGTQLLGNDQVPIKDPTGSVNIDLYQFDPRFDASTNAFPNGFMVTDAVDKSGDRLASLENRFFFSSLGYVNLSMNVGVEEVMGFSKPVTLEMEVPRDLTNPVTGKPIEKTFEIPVWSLNASTGQWTNEENIALFEEGGKLFARFRMTHLSTWNLDIKVDACTPPASGKITVNIDNTGRGFKARYADFNNSVSGMTLSPTNANNIVLLQSNEVHALNVINAPDVAGGSGLQFRLYNTVRKTDGIDRTLNNVICGSTRNMDLSGDPSDCVHFELYIECSDFGNACFRPELVGLWYEQGLLTAGEEPDDIEYQEARYAGVPKNGGLDIDMTDIKNKVGSGASYYRFLLQFSSTSGTTTHTKAFDIRYDGGMAKWNNPGIDASVKTFEQIIPPPPGTYCAQWYRILLEFDCGFDPGVHYSAGCTSS